MKSLSSAFTSILTSQQKCVSRALGDRRHWNFKQYWNLTALTTLAIAFDTEAQDSTEDLTTKEETVQLAESGAHATKQQHCCGQWSQPICCQLPGTASQHIERVL